MSEIRVDKLSPNSTSNLDFGESGKTFTVPNGAKIQAAPGGTILVNSGATLDVDGTANFSGATVTLDNDELSGDAIDGGTISNFASTGIDDNANQKVLEVNNSATNGIKVTRPFWAQTACLAYGRLTVTTSSGIAIAASLSRSFNCNTPSVSAGTITVNFTVGAQAQAGPNSTTSTPFAMVTADCSSKQVGESIGSWQALTHSRIDFLVDGTAAGLGKIKFPASASDSTIDFLVFNPAAPEF